MSKGTKKVEPYVIEGGLVVDDRGEVSFVNDFQFEGIKRFYVVTNNRIGFVRAWHAHRYEAKYVTVVQGAAVVAGVSIDDWDHPSKDTHVHRYVLSCHKPRMVFIPAGYANGFMSLTEDAKLIFFSTASMEESREDDVRYDARYWNIWHVVER